MKGPLCSIIGCPWARRWPKPTRCCKRVETILQNTPDVAGYLRRTGAELGFFATESFRGDILVSLKPPGQRRTMEELFDVLREQLAREVPELATRGIRAAGARSNQRPKRREKPGRSQDLRARSGHAPRPGRAGRQDPRTMGEGEKSRRREYERAAGQSRTSSSGPTAFKPPAWDCRPRTWKRNSTRPFTAKWPARCPSKIA